MALEMFDEKPYSTVEEDARRCYFLRAQDRFAILFGLAELDVQSRKLYRQKYLVRKSELLDQFVSFR